MATSACGGIDPSLEAGAFVVPHDILDKTTRREKTYFDDTGLLGREHYRQFAGVLDELRGLDERTVVYSDALEYIDRENEAAEGLELETKLLADVRRGGDSRRDVFRLR